MVGCFVVVGVCLFVCLFFSEQDRARLMFVEMGVTQALCLWKQGKTALMVVTTNLHGRYGCYFCENSHTDLVFVENGRMGLMFVDTRVHGSFVCGNRIIRV